MCAIQEHLVLFLNSKLYFNHHVGNKINNCNKIIEVMKQPSLSISWNILLIIYKSFVRPPTPTLV